MCLQRPKDNKKVISIRKINLLCLIPLASLVLTACVLPGSRTSPDSPQWHAHQQAVQKLTAYQARGAFAYLADPKKVYARFFWQQYSPDHYRLLLTNPLGSTELELNVQKTVVQLTDSQGKRYISDDPEEMIRKLTGMSIPLNELRQWMLGLPGEATTFTLDDQYRLRKLTYQQEELTWTVDYQDYDSDLTPSLPRRLELLQGDQRIKLKMDNWTLQ